MPAQKSDEVRKGFHVALNPNNPEANSWYDPRTGVNLFLNTPESHDLSGYSLEELAAVARGIRAGLLIVSRGSVPEGLDLSAVNVFAAPRSRWGADHQDKIQEALRNHQVAMSKVS